MKNIREMTDDQIIEICGIATTEVIEMDRLRAYLKGGSTDFKCKIVKEVWNAPKDGEKELLVIRVYLDGYGDKTFFHIWEGDENSDPIELDFVLDSEDHHMQGVVGIVKKLIEWEFV